MLPNLIVAGAGKSGTSSLHLYLDQHPDIAMTSTKEPHFFSDADRYALGPSFYAGLFDAAAEPVRYHGESSTGYFIFPDAPLRIRASVPDCRLIFLLRNPVDRAISHYRWLVGLGVESRDFRTAFNSDRDEIPDPGSSRAGTYGYICQEGRFGTNLDRFASQFPAHQILLLVAEDLRSEPLSCLNRCCEFLEIDPFASITAISANESQTLSHPRIRARLEGRAASQRSGHARALLRSVLGERLARGLRDAAVATLGSALVDVPINVERSWLRDIYASEVASVRARDRSFVDVWQSDFPI